MVLTFVKNYSRNQASEHLLVEMLESYLGSTVREVTEIYDQTKNCLYLRLGTSLLVEEVVVQDTVEDSHLTLHHVHWIQHLYYLMMARVELLLAVLYRKEESAQLMVSVVVVFDLHQLPLSYLYRKLSNYLILSAMVSIECSYI